MSDKLRPMTWPRHKPEPTTVIEVGRTTHGPAHYRQFLRYGVDLAPLPDDDHLELIGRKVERGKRR